jgi:hypothetical protein
MSLGLLCNYESSDEDEGEDATIVTSIQSKASLDHLVSTRPHSPPNSDTLVAAYYPSSSEGSEEASASHSLAGVENEGLEVEQAGGVDEDAVPDYSEQTGHAEEAATQAGPNSIFAGIGRTRVPPVLFKG